jgi:hypothetical protein
MEQVKRIELSQSAWKAEVLPLNYTCMVGKTGFEPATSWSQTKRSTKLSYFPKSIFIFKKMARPTGIEPIAF